MITRILYNEEKDAYSKVVTHPIQTWEWGDFQESQGHKVYRLGVFDQQKMVSAYSLSFHKIPHTNFSIGNIPRGPEIDNDLIKNVKKIAETENAIFIKIEPDVIEKIYDNNYQLIKNKATVLNFPNLITSPKVAFYPHSFIINLTLSEDQLLANLSPKTRYNIKVANRHGVVISHSASDQDFEVYLKLLFDTTKRQGFYLHSENYHRQLWKTLKNTGLVEIFQATYQGQVLAAFMVFKLKDRLFYPYGASLDTHREVMAPTLLMWEVIKYGQSLGLKSFDTWGCLGPDAHEGENGYGFHRFKQGYGGNLVQFVGTYDLVINQNLYKAYNFIDKYRWKLLRLKASIFR
ncbi:MAG: peptidoglycan bridge formation glycyltransferase FemA/FemB family protein [Candidatus Shapirobacteria bacterium]|jgi:lipid II:glycine glycyltransferase (peptidoglycan interpeptide bridge formation enzyme)